MTGMTSVGNSQVTKIWWPSDASCGKFLCSLWHIKQESENTFNVYMFDYVNV